MSSNLTNETGDQVLAGRSLVVVLRGKTTDNDQVCDESSHRQQDNSGAAVTLHHPRQLQSQRTGWDIFNDFVGENKDCYWNPHLEESIRNLQYIGYLHPTTLLVGGRDIYIDTVRGAWTRRVLRPPKGFQIVRVGDLESLETQPVRQTQFTPLPEALCMAVADLNRSHTPATFSAIQHSLAHTYRRVHPPSDEIIYETLGSLIRENKIVYSGGSYFAMTPDLHMLHTNCIVVHDNHLVIAGDGSAPGGSVFPQFPTLFIPLGVTTERRSISCQTDVRENEKSDIYGQKLDSSMSSHNTTDDDPIGQKKSFGRSRSVRETRKKKEKADSLTRSESLRYNGERSRQLVKDINLKSSIVHQNKVKGEKTSLLSKLFGRGSSKKRSQSVGDRLSAGKPQVEYATFSAQFPPPDLALQIQRMQLQQHGAATRRQDVATQSEVNEEDEDYGYSQLSPVHVCQSRGWTSDHPRGQGSCERGECTDPRLATKRDRSVTKSHGRRNTDCSQKCNKRDLKDGLSNGKRTTVADVLTESRRRDVNGPDVAGSAFALSTQRDLRDAFSHKRGVRSDVKSTLRDGVGSHHQMDCHLKQASRHCKQGVDVEKWNNDAKCMSRSWHQDIVVGSPCDQRNAELKHMSRSGTGRRDQCITPATNEMSRSGRQDQCITPATNEMSRSGRQDQCITPATNEMSRSGRQDQCITPATNEMSRSGRRDQCITPANERRTKASMQNTHVEAPSPIVDATEGHRVNRGKKQRRRSRRLARDDEYCHDCHDTSARQDLNDAVIQPTSPPMLLNNGCPEAEHMAERDGHRLRVFQKYREMYSGSTLDTGGDASVEYCGYLPQTSRGMSRDSGVNVVGLAGHKYPMRSLGGAVGDTSEYLQDSGFNSPRGLQVTPGRSVPPGEGVTFVQNLRHLPDVPTECQPCPAGGADSPRWRSTDVGCSWSSSSRQTVLPAREESPRSHPKSSLVSAKHKQSIGTSSQLVAMTTECADGRTFANEKVRIRSRDRSPKKHIIGNHGDHYHKSRAVDSVSRHPAVTEKQTRGSHGNTEGATEPHFREGLLLADGSSGQYMSYKDLGDCKIVAVV